VANFDVRDGMAHTRNLTIDTRTMLIRGEGDVNLRDETLDLRLQGKPKSARLIESPRRSRCADTGATRASASMSDVRQVKAD